MTNQSNRTGWSLFLWSIVGIILPLTIGFLISMCIPQPVIGVIRLNDSIYSQTANDLITQIQFARQNPSIKGVVLVLDSPGGTVADTESVYLELISLRQTKPVISVIGSMAASGAYYLAVGTDYIYAQPTSDVGNIGVIGYLPAPPVVFEDVLSTGPYKMWGQPRDIFQRQMEMIKQGFLQAVKLGRSNALNISDEIILRGEIYPGTEALRLGLIDAIGSQSDAQVRTAILAKVRHYRVAELWDLSGLAEKYQAAYLSNTDSLNAANLNPGLYLLYLHPAESQQ